MNIIRKEGVFRLYDRQATLILTDEKQLERIATEPDKPLFDDAELGFSNEKKKMYAAGTTLDSFCRDAAARGCERIEVSYDFFFGGTTRCNYPDSPTTIAAFKQIHDCAAKYGMTFGASLISPLDLGGGYARHHDNVGLQWHFREGQIVDGNYTVEMRRQIQWYNNKGPIQLRINRVMAVAFDETRIGSSARFYVDENAIEDISSTVQWELKPDSYVLTDQGYAYDGIKIYGHTDKPCSRLLVVIEYRMPEMDYFDEHALDYIKGVIDKHNEKGISYNGFYSDEMHIQFDWDLFNHFGPETEITTRYVTPSLIDTYARLYGEKYRDFLKYMVYFAYQQHQFLGGSEAKEGSQHVMGKDADGAYETWLFRKRYFELLSGRVLNLSIDAKTYAEGLFGAPIMCRAHATWQESPTCDHFDTDIGFQMNGAKNHITRYDYDKPYIWGTSIRESISACCDYFRWNEFLSGAGTDHAEGGYADRNYYAQALAASFGSLNRFEKAYCAGWGSPKAVLRRFNDVGVTYGTADKLEALIQDMQHRSSDVLCLHPLDLTYDEERFGTWMVQYGYCNYITQEMLLKYGYEQDGKLIVNGRPYRALVALFELFIDEKLLGMLEAFVEHGGKLLWTGVPALRTTDGKNCAARFMKLFGLSRVASAEEALRLEDQTVSFTGKFNGIAPMTILTGFLPDAVYPVEAADAAPAARCAGHTIGTFVRRGAGECVYLGFRPRDDQSGSKGEDVHTLFDVLCAMEAYAPDSTEVLSRPADAKYVFNRFPNGAVSVANHYRTFHEDWPGLFYRDDAEDAECLKDRVLPPIDIAFEGSKLCGHTLRYSGTDALTYQYKEGALTGFCGRECTGIAIDDREWCFSETPVNLAFVAPEAHRLADDVKEALLIRCDKPATLTIPCNFVPENGAACKLDYFVADIPVEWKYDSGNVKLTVTEDLCDKVIAFTR